MAFRFKTFIAVGLSFALISCQTVTVRPDGGVGKLTSPPDYQERQHFFLGGLTNEAVIPVGKICAGKKAVQLQSQTTFMDKLIPFLLLVVGTTVSVVSYFKAEDPAVGLSGTFPISSSIMTLATVFLLPHLYTPKTAKVWCGAAEEKTTAKTAQKAGEEPAVGVLEAI